MPHLYNTRFGYYVAEALATKFTLKHRQRMGLVVQRKHTHTYITVHNVYTYIYIYIQERMLGSFFGAFVKFGGLRVYGICVLWCIW